MPRTATPWCAASPERADGPSAAVEGRLLLGDECRHGRGVVLARAGDGHLVGFLCQGLTQLVTCREGHRAPDGAVGHGGAGREGPGQLAVSYTHLRAHETGRNLVC